MRVEPLSDRALVRATPIVRVRPLVAAFAACIGVFAWLSIEVARDNTQAADGTVLAWMIGQRVPLLTALATDITALGSTIFLALAAGLVTAHLWAGGARRAGVRTAVACSAAALVTHATKVIVGRPRPALADQLLAVTGFSFPSGHTSGIAALLTATALYAIEVVPSRTHRLLIAAAHLAIMLAVGCSRLYLGVHYPSDVAAGLCLGVACALAAHALVRTPALARFLSAPRR